MNQKYTVAINCLKQPNAATPQQIGKSRLKLRQRRNNAPFWLRQNNHITFTLRNRIFELTSYLPKPIQFVSFQST
jgi:hypothetical protein